MLRRLRVRWPLPVAIAVVAPVVVAAWTLTAVWAQSPSSGPSASPMLPGDPARGAQLYGQTCTSCHGASLEESVGPRLNPITNLGNTKNPLNPTYLEDVITNGLSGWGGYSTPMPKKGNNAALTAADIRDLTAFIIQQNEQKGTTALDPVMLARSNVFWVTVSVSLLVLVTWLLARYNMRWIARRAGESRRRGPGQS